MSASEQATNPSNDPVRSGLQGESTQLTPADLALADRLIRDLEARSRTWPRSRGGQLAVGVVLLIFAVLFAAISHNIWSSPPESWLVGEVADRDAIQYVDVRITLAVAAAGAFMVGLLQACVGGWMIVSCLSNWNRHLRDALVAKALREYLANVHGRHYQPARVAEPPRLLPILARTWADVWSGRSGRIETIAMVLVMACVLAALASLAIFAWIIRPAALIAAPYWPAASDQTVILSYSTAAAVFVLVAAALVVVRARSASRGEPLPRPTAPLTRRTVAGVLVHFLPVVGLLWFLIWWIGTKLVHSVRGEGEWLGIAAVCFGAAATLQWLLISWRLFVERSAGQPGFQRGGGSVASDGTWN